MESSWTKLIPKSGPRFAEMMAALRTAGLPEIAAEYSTLSERLISCETNYIYQSTNTLPEFAPEAAYNYVNFAQLPVYQNINAIPEDTVHYFWP